MENYIIAILVIVLVGLFIKNILFAPLSTHDPLSNVQQTANAAKEDEPIVEGRFTPKSLYKFNGFDTENIYIAVKRNVYDVSKARQFYGPSGPYSNFAGHDASRGLAKNSFEMDVIRSYGEPIDDLADLTPEELESLNGWESTFKSKYPVVGVLVDE
ncbi:Cytochrome P450 protein Erg11p regulator protein [Komagataella phaffii CBS 7435]|uniref:Heme-binding protein involved in regulation of cytochrome P450 protein Erg11p n=2 Tax=Komagataella phaffii TaxID=460519 RepID=C4R7S1_KOMPG|nr:Heme-binding protein involved in regulation of cytochrome P450 protein Erg11p [Komagataella phaffii GS115]AOA64464.1 GQ67_04747T0 [Komagataella phaffii]CAH2450971.1 Cytochrome P450 protein Erg11p regulator protein [Komagataella phaffii CBS 7435]AOA70186.1 GQ68_04719T0 [Komagataella phaffii GS115]CAY71646.1 Heme-binding protein involved in regulation of cytochrome P450 protein Erg11p [Komagataella phaffii GS115]CCA40750.1 Cytochrome P450 protein Erg11p regulator protein [Komagataella phaffii